MWVLEDTHGSGSRAVTGPAALPYADSHLRWMSCIRKDARGEFAVAVTPGFHQKPVSIARVRTTPLPRFFKYRMLRKC